MPTTFADLGVPEPIARRLADRGIVEPFDIQIATIPDALAGRDICGRAPTGSGKTMAFGIPLVATVGKSAPRHPEGLVLAPTRELALQITNELVPLAQGRKRYVEAIYGGVPYDRQAKSVRRGVDILVATPGRLEDMIDRGDVSLDKVKFAVIDEADQMADMGFLPPVRRILGQCSPKRQTLLFSATLDGDIALLTKEFQKNPVRHEIGSAEPDITAMTHIFWETPREKRIELAARAVRSMGPTIAFVRTRHGAERIAKQLTAAGVEAVAIHGDRSQSQRERALKAFEKGKAEVLVATDVAARGVHVDDVACVIHLDPPAEHKAYVHRSGRTARAGAKGFVISMLQRNQIKTARRMGEQLGFAVRVTDPEDSPGFALVDRVKPRTDSGQSSKPSGGRQRTDRPKPTRTTRERPAVSRAAGQPTSRPKPEQRSATTEPDSPGRPRREKKRHRDKASTKDHGAPKRVKDRLAAEAKAKDAAEKAQRRKKSAGKPVEQFDGGESPGRSAGPKKKSGGQRPSGGTARSKPGARKGTKGRPSSRSRDSTRGSSDNRRGGRGGPGRPGGSGRR